METKIKKNEKKETKRVLANIFPCKDCITLPICKSMVSEYITYFHRPSGYSVIYYICYSLSNRCSIFKEYANTLTFNDLTVLSESDELLKETFILYSKDKK